MTGKAYPNSDITASGEFFNNGEKRRDCVIALSYVSAIEQAKQPLASTAASSLKPIAAPISKDLNQVGATGAAIQSSSTDAKQETVEDSAVSNAEAEAKKQAEDAAALAKQKELEDAALAKKKADDEMAAKVKQMETQLEQEKAYRLQIYIGITVFLFFLVAALMLIRSRSKKLSKDDVVIKLDRVDDAESPKSGGRITKNWIVLASLTVLLMICSVSNYEFNFNEGVDKLNISLNGKCAPINESMCAGDTLTYVRSNDGGAVTYTLGKLSDVRDDWRFEKIYGRGLGLLHIKTIDKNVYRVAKIDGAKMYWGDPVTDKQIPSANQGKMLEGDVMTLYKCQDTSASIVNAHQPHDVVSVKSKRVPDADWLCGAGANFMLDRTRYWLSPRSQVASMGETDMENLRATMISAANNWDNSDQLIKLWSILIEEVDHNPQKHVISYQQNGAGRYIDFWKSECIKYANKGGLY